MEVILENRTVLAKIVNVRQTSKIYTWACADYVMTPLAPLDMLDKRPDKEPCRAPTIRGNLVLQKFRTSTHYTSGGMRKIGID